MSCKFRRTAKVLTVVVVLEFNDTSTIVGHFVSPLREREKEIEEIVEEMKEMDRQERGTGRKCCARLICSYTPFSLEKTQLTVVYIGNMMTHMRNSV